MNRWYEKEFEKAVAKSKEWGLEVPECSKTDEELDIGEIGNAFYDFARRSGWTFPHSLAGHGIDRHVDAKLWLEQSLGLQTVLTIGEVFINGTPRYGTTFDLLRREIEAPVTATRTFDAHVWLTLPNYGVLDVVLPASICGDSFNEKGPPKLKARDFILFAGPESRERGRSSTVTLPRSSPDGSFFYRDVYGKKKKVAYNPMLVGLGFLAASDPSLQEQIRRYQ
jgi:hypothetical protein